MNPVLIALFAFLGGCLFIGLVVFLVLLYRSFGQMTRSFEVNSMHMENLAEAIPEMLAQWNEAFKQLMDGQSKSAIGIGSAINAMTTSVESAAAVSKKATPVFAEITEQVKLLIKSFNAFNAMVWKQQDATEEHPTPLAPRQPEGSFFGYDETKMAAEEVITEARKHGIELQESALYRPDQTRMVGGDDPKSKQPDSRGPVPPAQNPPDTSGGNSAAGQG